MRPETSKLPLVMVRVHTQSERCLKSVPPEGWGQGAMVGLSGGRTATETVSAVLELVPSFTTSENTRSLRTEGAVKLGIWAVVSSRVTVAPLVCVQA